MNKQAIFRSLLALALLLGIIWSCKKEDPAVTPTTPTTPTTPVVTKSTAKDITKFGFAALSPAVDATIDATAKTISTTLPAATDLTKLVPTITLSPKATVSPATGTSQNFANPVTYTVTAEDGSTQAYNVAITVTPTPVATTKTIKSNSDLPDVLEDLSDGVDYIVSANITISGTRVVTVKPGVKIQFDGGSSGFTVSSQSALKMIGTAAKPIILEGKVATAGSWKGISIEAINIENQWEYVTLSYGGGNSQAAGLLVDGINDAIRVSIKNCTFSNNLGYGIWCNDKYYIGTTFGGFSNNTFTDNTKSALKIRAAEMGNLDAQSKYINNGQKFIEVARMESPLADPITVKKIEVPYRVYSVIKSRDKITINAGVTMEFTTSSGFELTYGTTFKNASIVANGTAADPIKFIGYISGTKGVWLGFVLENGNIENSLKYCQIDGAGSDNVGCGVNFKGAVLFGNGCGDAGRGTITNCTITNSGGYGILYRDSDAVTIKDNTFKDNTKADTYLFK